MAERRVVTVLFADLVGFTPFAEERDPEEVRATLGRYFELATEVISRYGGTVEKFIGDAVMAVWGAPTAHEDDAERAVRAGLDLVGSIPAVGPGIDARAGIMTGEVAMTIGAANQGLVAGDLVNTAARLQAVAPPGWVLVGEATQRAASRAVAFEAAGDQALKGKATPLPAWRAVRIVAERGGRNRTETLEPPFVGRDDELRLIKDLFHATSREGRARLVSVIGPAGIGKTRLAWEFSKYLDGLIEGVWFHEGRSPSYGEGITFWALGEMVRRRAGLAETDDEETTRAKVAATVAEHVPDEDERRWIEAALLALLGLDRDLPSDQLFAAWRTFFERLASSGPVVLVFEDFHHADPGLLDFVDHLMDWSRGVPIYVLTLARPELLERRKDWAVGKRSFVGLTLEPLSAESMRTMLEGLVHGLPKPALEAIVARAEGVPLYAVEIVRMLAADGRLVAAGDAYRAQGDLGPITMPETLTALISSRLDALDPADRALLQDASVLGLSFVPTHLAAVAGADLTVVEGRLGGLVDREFLGLVVDQRSPERGQYRFVQAVIREVAYNTLARPDRKARHLAAARSFESLGTPEIAGALAGHYLAARDLAPEGPERDALAGQARLALVGAAERAADLGAHDQALAFFEQALSLASAAPDRAGLLERAGASATHAGRHDQATAMLTEAVELRRTLGDREAIAGATAKLAGALFMGHDVERATALLRAAVDELSDIGPSPDLVELQALLARALFLGGDSPAAIGIADEALPTAERLDAVLPLADLLVTRGSALWDVGRLVEGIGVIEIGERLARSKGLTTPHLRALNNRAVHLFDVDVAEARPVVREAIAVARRIGSRDWELNFLGFAGRA
ncbi:MAG TPA: adenylate/guanylate cyclase domain-containing protein, partial [Candidatus Binatia bacterium]|nr:adenylate/guanylate cyclase domain-containing protein [Candidatus Binatia bacterium]